MNDVVNALDNSTWLKIKVARMEVGITTKKYNKFKKRRREYLFGINLLYILYVTSIEVLNLILARALRRGLFLSFPSSFTSSYL